MAKLPDEAVEKSANSGLRRGSRWSRFTDHPKSLDEADQYPRGTCRLNTAASSPAAFARENAPAALASIA